MVSLHDALTGVCKIEDFRNSFKEAFHEPGKYFKKIEKNVMNLWKQEFVLAGGIKWLPASLPVVRAHVPVADDVKTGFCYRADLVLRDHCEKGIRTNAENAEELRSVLDSMDSNALSLEGLIAKMNEYSITAPNTENILSYPYFVETKTERIEEDLDLAPKLVKPLRTYVGPDREQLFYKFFHDLCDEEAVVWLPFAVAHQGSFYKEKLGKRGRDDEKEWIMTETTIAEIRHFVDPEYKSHSKFSEMEDLKLNMCSCEDQLQYELGKKIKLGEALSKGSINNETIGYYIGRVFLFLAGVGIDKDHLRFRQRVGNEKGQSAADCWTCEVESSFGWVECVAVTERSAYDLQAQAAKVGVSLVVHDESAELREVEKVLIEPNEVVLGAFEGSKKMVVEALLGMSENEALKMKATLESKAWAEVCVRPVGRRVGIGKNMVNISRSFTQEQGDIRPCVIELSFSMDRITHFVYEHSFCTRQFNWDDKERKLFRFLPQIAPFKCAVFHWDRASQFGPVVERISLSLEAAGVAHKKEIGGRTLRVQYDRCDALGMPLAIVVNSLNEVEIRDRDTAGRTRVRVEDVVSFVKNFISERTRMPYHYEHAG